jgi:hypothetical protein
MFRSVLCSWSLDCRYVFRETVYQLQYALKVDGKIVDISTYTKTTIYSKILEKMKAKGITVLPEGDQTVFSAARSLKSLYSATILKLFSRKDADALAKILRANLCTKWKGQFGFAKYSSALCFFLPKNPTSRL